MRAIRWLRVVVLALAALAAGQAAQRAAGYATIKVGFGATPAK